MAKRSRTSSPKTAPVSKHGVFPITDASVEAVWQEALSYRSNSPDPRAKSRQRLAEAHAARAEAEAQAITATKSYCADARAQADENLLRSEQLLSKAERVRADALEWVAGMEEEIKFRLEDADRIRESAREFAAKHEETARAAVDALMDQTRIGAEELATRMRTESAADIRKILTDIEIARASAEDELEAQRLLTETARIKAFSSALGNDEQVEAPVEFTPTTKKKPAASSKRKRSTKSSAVRKAA